MNGERRDRATCLKESIVHDVSKHKKNIYTRRINLALGGIAELNRNSCGKTGQGHQGGCELACEMKIFAICLGLMMMLNIGSAASYEFGSKVRIGDVDVGGSLTSAQLSVYYLDTLAVLGLDPTDGAYLHQSIADNVSPNDIRLTPFLGHPAGSRVKIGDPDRGMGIAALPGRWSYSELFIPNHICDINEPVYYKAITSRSLAVMDLRLSKLQFLNPGSWVKGSDSDFNNPTFQRPFEIMYHEMSTPGYDDSDPVYLKINMAYPDNVSPGDLRLVALNGEN
jgi:hypothetical protein